MRKSKNTSKSVATANETPPPSPSKRNRSPRASGRVTLTDVAQAVGVSAMTVSRALRGGRGVHTDLVQKVQHAAQAMGYVPDPAARALASQRSDQVLVLVPLLSNALFVDLLEAAHKVLFAAGLHPLIGVTHYDPAEEEQLLRTYLSLRPAGLMLTGFDHTPGAQELLANCNIPTVHMMELAPAGGPLSVGFSQEKAGAELTRHLVERGYKRIAFAAGQLDARVRQRAAGWKRVLKSKRMYSTKLEYLWPQPTSMALGAELLTHIRANDPTVDAIFFCNDDIAQGALLEALRQGLRVPQDIAIVGFNDLAASAQMVPALTTIRTPRKQIGEHAARLLLSLIRQEPVESRQIDLGYELVKRASS